MRSRRQDRLAGTLVVLAFSLVPVVQGIGTRLNAFAPKTTAAIAVVNTDEAYAAGRAAEAKPEPIWIPPP